MPWNCLRLTKEKRRIEISGPILNEDDSQSIHLLPATKQTKQHTTSDCHSSTTKQLNRYSSIIRKNQSNDKNLNSNTPVTTDSHSIQSSKVKLAKQKENPSTTTIPATGGNAQSKTKRVSVKKKEKKEKNKKNSKQFVNIKFSFKKANNTNGPSISKHLQTANNNAAAAGADVITEHVSLNEITAENNTKIAELNYCTCSSHPSDNVKKNTATTTNSKNLENAGNYDEIPFIIDAVDSVSYAEKSSPSITTTTGQLHPLRTTRSNDSIPFIDKDAPSSSSKPSTPQHQIFYAEATPTCGNVHTDRFITLQPRNRGSSLTSSHRSDIEKYTQLSLSFQQENGTATTMPMGEKETQTPEEMRPVPSIEHDFRLWQFPQRKPCQVCHEPMIGSFVAFKCRSCELTCHEWCAAPNIRYHDTSFIIFRKWLESQEKYAFPNLHRYNYSKKLNKSTEDTHNLTDSECINDKASPREGELQLHYSPMSKKRRSLSETEINGLLHDTFDEKQLKWCNNIAKVVSSPDESTVNETGIRLRIEESPNNHQQNTISSNRSSTNSQNGLPSGPTNVLVDVHHRPDSDVLLTINEQTDDYLKPITSHTKENVPEADISVNGKLLITTLPVVEPSNQNSVLVSRNGYTDAIPQNQEDDNNRIVKEEIKQNLPVVSDDLSISSVANDSSDIDTVLDYAKVELRPMKNNEHNANNHEQHIIKSQSFPIQTKSNNRQSSDSLRLHYVTQRILASILPKRDPENQIRINGKLEDKHEIEILSMLEQKHGKNYRVFDLESCISIITLERICELCKHIDSWLGTGQEKVVVLQDREDRQRLGTAISAYLEYLDICSTNYTGRNASSNEDIRIQNTIARNWLDLDIFSMRKFLEDFIGSQRIPSHRRYLEYFAGLLAGKIRMNSAPLYLKRISIESPPTWLRYDNRLATQSSEWITFIKIYEGLRCVHISDIHIIPITTRQFLFEIGSLRLRGDILIRCYHIISSGLQQSGYNQETRELLFSIQFHTCAVGSRDVVFYRKDMDLACDDSRFPSDHKAVFYFTNNTSKENGLVFQSPLIRTQASNEIAKFDSIENIDIASSCHTHGPIDGSLYATILKSPKSPQFTFPFPTNNSSPSIHQQQQQKHQAYSSQNLISPPPQFSNQNQQQRKKDYEFIENSQAVVALGNDTVDRGTINVVPKITGNNLTKLENSNNQQIVSRPGGRNSIETQHQLAASKPQSNFRETHKYTVPVNLNPLETRNITIVETYNSAIDKRYGPNYHQQQHGGGQQECVRSPLTLSMDSGISSNGILNRPQPGSSVSPSSFPSQASPQEDRDRELDDILSDMLMTVQDIPDFSKSTKQQNQQHSHTIVRSQSVIPTSGNYVVPVQYNSNQQLSSHYNNTIKRSQSYNIEQPSPFGQNSYIPKDRQQDIYDTASTTTTLTPPPSESGRDTPIGGVYSNSGSVTNISATSEHQYRQTIPREKREISYSAAAIPIGSNQQQQQRQQMIMSLHQQSTIYPQTVRTDSVTVSASEDEEIPYHAREYSQPFSYGSVPPNNTFRTVSPSDNDDPAMIKTQSGLSSPSLVRKTLRAPSPSMSGGSLRKTPQRVDFEEMLRDRREKVMSEKYSKSDRPSNFSDFGSRSFDGENQWSYNNSSSYRANHQDSYDQSGRHRLYEPLRRSNTMDGPFLRSNSTDGISGQTWLQLQQQKLRAKKDQEYNDNRRYFEEVIHNEIRGRPFRSRANYSRNDGYASDTAAFTDEVDYRRPLQIQTPYYQKLPHEAFNTKITTTTTVTRERPFVAVKRAHDQAKQSAINSPPLSPLTLLRAAPHGQINQARQPPQQQQNGGLLSMADSPDNGHIRLDSTKSSNSKNGNDAKTYDSKTIVRNRKYLGQQSESGHIHHTSPYATNAKNNHQDDIINKNYIINNNDNAENMRRSYDQSQLNSKISPSAGQLTLDRLIASLATDSFSSSDYHDAETNNNTANNSNNVELRKQSTREHQNKNNARAHGAYHPKYSSNPEEIILNDKTLKNSNLSTVISDVTDFKRYEQFITNCYTDSFNHNGNNGRLVLESDNSSSISPSSTSERSNIESWSDQQKVREESFSSYRSETDPELSITSSPRPETPAFPVTPRTPYGLSINGSVSPALPPKSPTSLRKDLYSGNQKGHLHEVVNQNDTISCYASRRNSNASNANSEPQEVAPHLVKFVRDSSKYWYKPNISREEAVVLLRNAEPGTFLVRDSTTYKNAFGLVVRVAQPPPGVELKTSTGDELVRHFLVEPTLRGVRLKGCNNEPVFSSLSALVYQHSITPLALPCRLIIPDRDIQSTEIHSPAQRQLLSQGAACNVLYLFTCETESLTGEEAIRKAVSQLFIRKPLPPPTEVHFKAAQQGITLTDNTRRNFFRKHYPANSVSFCGLDPERRTWSIPAHVADIPVNNKTIFAFVARRSASSKDNQCHVFCDLQSNQPALAIVSFVNKVLPTEMLINSSI